MHVSCFCTYTDVLKCLMRRLWKNLSPQAFPLELSAFTFHLRRHYLICGAFSTFAYIHTHVHRLCKLFVVSVKYGFSPSFVLCKSLESDSVMEHSVFNHNFITLILLLKERLLHMQQKRHLKFALFSKGIHSKYQQSISKCSDALKIYAACAHEGSMCLCVLLLELAGIFPSNCSSEMPHSLLAWGKVQATVVAVATCQTTRNEKEKETVKRN